MSNYQFTDEIKSLFGRPPPALTFPTLQPFTQPTPQFSQPPSNIFQEIQLSTTPQPFAKQVISKQNEISGSEIVPILPPNTEEYNDYNEYDSEYNDYDYSDNYNDYDYSSNNIDEGFREPDVFNQQPPVFQKPEPVFERPEPVFEPEPEVIPIFEPSSPFDNSPPVINGFQVIEPPQNPVFSTGTPNVISTTVQPTPSFPEPPLKFIDDQNSVPSYHEPSYTYYGYGPPTTPEPDIIDILPAETSLQDPNLQCYERTCDQNITGKNVRYNTLCASFLFKVTHSVTTK